MSKSYDLSTSSKWSTLSDGNHNITIVAKADGYRDSEHSSAVTVTKQSTATLISFTIDGTSYQAEEGMTWAQWVNSSYNTDSNFISFNNEILASVNGFVVSYNGMTVKTSEIIVANRAYYLSSGGSGN